MTREDIIRMAREAGLDQDVEEYGLDGVWVQDTEITENIERLVEIVRADERNRVWTQDHWTEYEHAIAAAEREACAKVCESMRPSEQEFDQRFYTACTLNANAIRARENT